MTDTQPEPIDAEMVARLEALLAAATGGEWQINGSHVYGGEPHRTLIAQVISPTCEADRDLIVALRNAAPALLAIARRQRPESGVAAVERVARAMYERVERGNGKRQRWDADADEIERAVYLDDARAAIAALATTPAASGETWRPDPRTVEACIRCCEDQQSEAHEMDLSDSDYDFERGVIDCIAAIEALSRDKAAKEGGDHGYI